VRRFDVSRVELVLEDENPNELNRLIRLFNQDYTQFIHLHYYDFARERYGGSEAFLTEQSANNPGSDILLRAPKKSDSTLVQVSSVPFGELVSSFTRQANDSYQDHFTDPFFRDYVQYTLAELELLAGRGRAELYQNYLHGRTVQYHHPSYMKFFDLFYSGSLSDQSDEKRKTIQKVILAGPADDALADIFSSDSLYQSKTIRELAVIKGLRDEYNNPVFSKKGIEATLLHFSSHLADHDLAAIAGNVRMKLMRCLKGWQLEDFTLLDDQNERWTWPQPESEYTYFLFAANWCSPCKKDLQALLTAPKEITRDVRIIVIGMDESYDEFRKLARSFHDPRISFLYGGTQAVIRETFQLKAIPHAALIDPAGKFAHDYTRRPTEGILTEFEAISKREKKGSGTWKD
jgi:thiol-disulfide isomerase/thioredoxin